MPISKDLLLSILSMDAYNRGYGEGISGLGGLGTAVGVATISTDSETTSSTNDVAQAAGFYAISYDTPYGTVISYRGTNADSAANFAVDAWNGYSVAIGSPFDDQAHLAAEFYQSVTGTSSSDPRTGSAILTGHSLGGGLAGFVGGPG